MAIGESGRASSRNSSKRSKKASSSQMHASSSASSSATGPPVKVAILGAAGGIGQPLALLLMLHSEHVQHIALYDLVHVKGIAADLSHVDRQCKITAHLGPEELQDAVRGAKVIVIPAGLAQKPGMSRDDLFGSNAKIVYNLAKVCAQVAPNAHIALISNPVNSLVPLTCEVYHRHLHGGATKQQNQQLHQHHQQSHESQTQQQQQQQQPAQQKAQDTTQHGSQEKQQQDGAANQQQQPQQQPATSPQGGTSTKTAFAECCRRIFGVTTLDLVRASTLTAKSSFYKAESSTSLGKDPAKVTVPVVGGHAGRTIIPLLSQATPKLDRERLVKEQNTTMTLIESIQQAGIDVLNAKKGAGSATLAMAYSACRFTINLLRAQAGEQNIIEYAYVKHAAPIIGELDYFSTPLVLGKEGYTKVLPLAQDGKPLLPFEQQMIEDGAKELLTSVAKGEDFAKEHLSAEK